MNKYLQIIALSFLIVITRNIMAANDWPVLKKYDSEHVNKIALPIGGIGTGTISLGGRGNFQDMEIMNRPAKGYNPGGSLFFTLFTEVGGTKDLRLLEGPVPFNQYEGEQGSTFPNHGLPRFEKSTFETSYPFGQVALSSEYVPLDVKIKSFNPLIPGDIDNSSIPMAVIDVELTNNSGKEVRFCVCGNLQNFIGEDGANGKAVKNKNTFLSKDGLNGILYTTEGIDDGMEQWGEMSLTTSGAGEISYRTSWLNRGWGNYNSVGLLNFWDDLSADGKLDNSIGDNTYKPMSSLALGNVLPAGETKTVRFLFTWYFPNRKSWSSEILENYYTTMYNGAWDVAAQTLSNLDNLEAQTIGFINTFCASDIPDVVKEAALFNVSTLRTQTCFRLSDGNFFTYEGCGDRQGLGRGSCTHVWNYETATAFLFGELAKTMREVEFDKATNDIGAMSFRVQLPYKDIPNFKKVAADGQMGCIMKLYREWQLSGDDNFLQTLYPKAKKALSYAWIKGGWDANQDGVMEGVQHNTMDVEYFGPNPQMTIWYLGALRAMEEMATFMKDNEMAGKCRGLFISGSKWTDENLFNGEYYIQKIETPRKENIREEQLMGWGAKNYGKPDFQLGEGCLVDQLVGQYMAHVCGLGYLVSKENIITTLESIMRYNYKPDLSNHFNCLRSFALGNEAGLLMASYPQKRPLIPFPYFTEVMTGFEYTAATGMLYEGQLGNGVKCIQSIRERYDGRKRSPFDEAEYGHHYGRAMASWSAILALTGFQYSGVDRSMIFTSEPGTYFWSNGYAWGSCEVKDRKAILTVHYGRLELERFTLQNVGTKKTGHKEISKSQSLTIQL